MTKIEIEAIKKLPEEYVLDDLQFALMKRKERADYIVIAAHSTLPPIWYDPVFRKWKTVTFQDSINEKST